MISWFQYKDISAKNQEWSWWDRLIIIGLVGLRVIFYTYYRLKFHTDSIPTGRDGISMFQNFYTEKSNRNEYKAKQRCHCKTLHLVQKSTGEMLMAIRPQTNRHSAFTIE